MRSGCTGDGPPLELLKAKLDGVWSNLTLNIFHYPKLIQTPSNLSVITSRDEELSLATLSYSCLGDVCPRWRGHLWGLIHTQFSRKSLNREDPTPNPKTPCFRICSPKNSTTVSKSTTFHFPTTYFPWIRKAGQNSCFSSVKWREMDGQRVGSTHGRKSKSFIPLSS